MPQTRTKDTKKTERREQPIDTEAAEQAQGNGEPVEPKVSAVLVTYNQLEALRRSVAALERSRDRERLEILVIDCASQDGSGQIDLEFEGVTVLRLPHHMGATRAMNIATRTAKAEFVFFLSPNAEVAPDTVQKLADRLDIETEAAAVCPLLVDPEGRTVSRFEELPTRATFRGEPPLQNVDASQEIAVVEYPGIGSLMVRKHFIKGMNYFDERFGHYWADADLAVKIRQAQRKILLFPAVRVTWHASPDPLEGDAIAAADKELGAAEFLGKYEGFFAGLGYRIGAILRALGRFDFRGLSALVSGQKLDGSQAM
jgi:glycosyltransferase involved in cell wall biosynthesis